MKCRVETIDGTWHDKIPAWIKWATQVSPCLCMHVHTVVERTRLGARHVRTHVHTCAHTQS